MIQDIESVVHVITPLHKFSAVYDNVLPLEVTPGDTLHVCDACLHTFGTVEHLQEHVQSCCNAYYIPGNEIYRCVTRSLTIFEIDGRKPQGGPYARRLAALARLFLTDKATVDDVHFFLFYVLYAIDDYGYHFVGYFSKEWKAVPACFNTLSCLVVFPPYQGKGYGSLLVAVSYELARREGVVGTPERPLSRTGKLMFRKCWMKEVLRAILSLEKRAVPVTLDNICTISAMIVEDVLVALQDMNIMFSSSDTDPFIMLDSSLPVKDDYDLDLDMLQWVPPL